MTDLISNKLDACTCGSMKKITATMLFGYLTLQCKDCGRKLTSESRSGCHEYLLEKEMLDRWNNGGVDE